MKKLAVLCVFTFGSASAFAADLPARTYTKAPPVPMVAAYDWSGFYVGLNGGGGSGRQCATAIGNVIGPRIPPVFADCNDATGGTIGGQLGYRWQATNWVFGLEAQGNWADFRGSAVNQATVPPGALNDITKIKAFGLFTGQVGYAFNNVLIYAKGGAAVANNDYSNTGTPAVGPFAGQLFATAAETRWGGVVGAGIEYGFAPHWSLALEYDHLFMGTNTVTYNPTATFGAGQPTFFQRTSQSVDIGTVRVNYRFGGPVVAKY